MSRAMTPKSQKENLERHILYIFLGHFPAFERHIIYSANSVSVLFLIPDMLRYLKIHRY